MTEDDIETVLAIEKVIYPFPWGANHFVDSLRSGYDAWIVESAIMPVPQTPLGYCVMMWAVDDTHLLNLSVAAEHQHRGLGRWLLGRLFDDCRDRGARSMLLEVRPSNPRAQRLYQNAGFEVIGTRRGYYPSYGQAREDAIVMRRMLGDPTTTGAVP